jgi:hypothetical protein
MKMESGKLKVKNVEKKGALTKSKTLSQKKMPRNT